jgi:hypothetical protein
MEPRWGYDVPNTIKCLKSVVLQWYLDDEEYGQKALSLLAKYVSEELDIIAPSLLAYEVIRGKI